MTQYNKTLVGFERAFNEPLEKNILFKTVAEMTAYMQSDPTKYNGQIVTVCGNGTSVKGVNYRLDISGSTWIAVPLADKDDVATKAQGAKADSAIQSATIGGVAVPKSGNAFQFPAFPTSLPASDKATILSEAAAAAQAKVDAHAGDTTKHITAAERTKWNSHQDAAQVKVIADNAINAKRGVANGIASLDSTGKVPAAQLPSYVDDVIDTYATYDVSATNEISNIKLYSDAAHKNAITGEPGKSYNDITEGHPGYQFRWSGTTWVQITSGGLIIGEIAGTAYVGNRGKELYDWMYKISGASISITNKNKLNNLSNLVITGLDCEQATDKVIVKGGLLDMNTAVATVQEKEILPATTARAGVLSSADYSEFKGKVGSTGNVSNTIVAFTPAVARNNVATGEKLSVLFGKVAKWFADLKALAFKDKVGTDDITDKSIIYNKLAANLQSNIDLVNQHLVKAVPLLLETADSKSATKSQLINSSVRVDSTTKITGVKKYAYIEIEKGHSDGDLLCIRDESGHIVTDLFTRTALIADISYEYTALTEIGTLYVSFLN